ncbi:MAG: WGR domain-containing protein, partial [Planctomycetota bacterium]
MKSENTTLYFREGSSDKVYQACLEQKNGAWVVNFAFGRRGATLQTGTKTTTPIPFEKAKVIYDKLVREKTGKGYTSGPDGTPYQHSDNAERVSGLLPQLLNPIDAAAAERMLNDPAWWMQEKKDGMRVLIRKEGSEVTGINRKGLTIGLPSRIIAHARALSGSFIIDGECVGDTLHAFD